MSDPLDRLPDEVTVSLEEVRATLNELEAVLAELRRQRPESALAGAVDDVIGRMTRWVWPVLGELDEEGDG